MNGFVTPSVPRVLILISALLLSACGVTDAPRSTQSNLTSAPIIPMTDAAGNPIPGMVVKKSDVVANGNPSLKCAVSKGERVQILGRNTRQSQYLVRTSSPCSTIRREGLIGSEQVEVTATPPMPQPLPPLTDGPTPTVPPGQGIGCEGVTVLGTNDEEAIDEGCFMPACAVAEGAFYRAEGRNLKLVVKGAASKWSIDSIHVSGKKHPQAKIEASSVKSGPREFTVPFSDFTPSNNWQDGLTLKIAALDPAEQPQGPQCSPKMALDSPLVLHFATGTLQTIDLFRSKTFFDLNADGIAERVGWILPSTGFLVRDINGNQTIDSGLELFGNHTRFSNGKTTSHGYAALSELDSHKDGFIDSKDSAFKSLQVWFDHNLNGRSEKTELKSLTDMNVSRIAVGYTNIKTLPKLSTLQNRVLYESRFWGPKHCGDRGCQTFDVYFGTLSSRLVSKK